MAALTDLVSYSQWASRRLLEFALTVPAEDVSRPIANSHGGILKTFQHIYYADRVWLNRLEKTAGDFEDPSPGPSLAEMNIAWWPVLERLALTTASREADEITTFNRTNGDAHTLPFGDLVTHVVNHATYHRGQIAAMLRQCGHVPPSTDLLYYRLGL